MRKILAILLSAISVFFVACQAPATTGHVCAYTMQKAEGRFLKSEATCKEKARYYYSCECGKAGEKTFTYGALGKHDYTAEVVANEYLKTVANCQDPAVYYKSCSVCGQKAYGSETFTSGSAGECAYVNEVVADEYLKKEATQSERAVYYKSCVCGKTGTATFLYGEKLKEFTQEEKIPYTPTSLTVTLYEPENSIYGFTWNTSSKPLRPVIQIQEGNALTDDCQEYVAEVELASSYNTDNTAITYYIVKAEIKLNPNKTYAYRAYDKYVEIGTAQTTIKTKDIKGTSFTFSHVSDTQTSGSTYTGSYFGKTLAEIVKTSDFIVHSGDVVENSKYEVQWTSMLNDNFSYLSTIPMMAISGNHETTYKNGSNETFKHFNNKLPVQESTEKGYFYSFVYGNAKFIMLNTNNLVGNKLETAQYNWLVNELQNNTATWTIVVLHNPLYSVGKYGANPTSNSVALALRTQLQGVFAQYGVDIVLQGHDHTISRTYPINGQGEPQTETIVEQNGVSYSKNPQGVVYMMNGPGGNDRRDPYAVDDSLYAYASASNACSWAEFEISGNSIKVTSKYLKNSTTTNYYTWGIVKD